MRQIHIWDMCDQQRMLPFLQQRCVCVYHFYNRYHKAQGWS